MQSGKTLSWPEPPLRWIGHRGSVRCVSYSPDGRHIVSGSFDHTIRIWDTEIGAAIGEPLEGHASWVASVAYSPDGRHIVSGSQDKTIRIWDAKAGAAVGGPLKGHTSGVRSVAYSPDGRHIISGSWDYTIRIWGSETGASVGQPLEGHTSDVMYVAYSPDGQHIISGSYGHTSRVWYAGTATIVGKPPQMHTRPVLSVAPSSIPRSSPQNLTCVNFRALPDPNGWVRDSQRGLLYWVPPDCRACLHSPAILTIPLTSRIRSVPLNFEDFVFGTSWTRVFNNVQR